MKLNADRKFPYNNEGVSFMDQLLGPLDGFRKDMRVLVIDIPSKDIEQYEETNARTI